MKSYLFILYLIFISLTLCQSSTSTSTTPSATSTSASADVGGGPSSTSDPTPISPTPTPPVGGGEQVQQNIPTSGYGVSYGQQPQQQQYPYQQQQYPYPQQQQYPYPQQQQYPYPQQQQYPYQQPPPTQQLPTQQLPPAQQLPPSQSQIPTQIPPVQIPSGQIPSGQIPSGQIPLPGQIPSGQIPSGQIPPGQIPPGQIPPGQIPPGQIPPGQMPSGQIPPGQIPPGQIPPPASTIPPVNTLPPTGTLPPASTIPPTGTLPPASTVPPTSSTTSLPQGAGLPVGGGPVNVIPKVSDFKTQMPDLDTFCQNVQQMYGTTTGFYTSTDGTALVGCSPTPKLYTCPDNQEIDPSCFPGQQCNAPCTSTTYPRPFFPTSFIAFTKTDVYVNNQLSNTVYGVAWYDYTIGQERLEQNGINFVTINYDNGTAVRKVLKDTFDQNGVPTTQQISQTPIDSAYQRCGVPQVSSLEGYTLENNLPVFLWKVQTGGASPFPDGTTYIKTSMPYQSDNNEYVSVPLEMQKSYVSNGQQIREVTDYLQFDHLEGVSGTYENGKFYPPDHSFTMSDWFSR